MGNKRADFVYGGKLYLFTWSYLATRTDLYDDPTQERVMMALPDMERMDIDTPMDLAYARWLAEQGHVNTAWVRR
jgi:hypothetical protein